jgi:hypothetical protein
MSEPDSDRLVTEFHPSNFANNSDRVDNTYLPLIPGTQFIYQGVANRGGGLSDHKVIFTVTDLVRTINGVNTVVVWDRDINDGELKESELAFFAQDKEGNVWNLGEYPEEYKNGEFDGAPDVWITGEKDAQGGIHMLADPREGARYVQGIAPNIEFHDVAKVINTDKELNSYTDVLVTKEWDPQELPATQRKFHAPDIGIVRVTAQNDPEGETLRLTNVRQLSAEKLKIVRQEALELEDHAYEISKVYREADPAGKNEIIIGRTEDKTENLRGDLFVFDDSITRSNEPKINDGPISIRIGITGDKDDAKEIEQVLKSFNAAVGGPNDKPIDFNDRTPETPERISDAFRLTHTPGSGFDFIDI